VPALNKTKKKPSKKANPAQTFKPSPQDLAGAPKRAKTILSILRKTHPDARCALNYRNALELLVATILSAQCTDERVNIVTKDLFVRYRRAADYADAPLSQLEKAIKSTGFFRNKAKSLQAACRDIVEKFDGKVPDTLDKLVTLAGVGRKTANVVLGNAFNTPAIVTDTHVIRLVRLMGLSGQKDPVKIEFDLRKLFDRKDWTILSHLLIFHGRRICIARKPDCHHCPVRPHCCYGRRQ